MNTLLETIKESLLFDVNTVVIPYIEGGSQYEAFEEVTYFISTYLPSIELLPKIEGKELLGYINTILGVYDIKTKLIRDFS